MTAFPPRSEPLSPPPGRLSANTALFLDLDGTLVEFAETPQAVILDASLRALIMRLHDGFAGGLALVSGRSLAVLDHLLAPVVVDAVGLHGGEWRIGGQRGSLPPPPPIFSTVAAELRRVAAGHPGIYVEDKGMALAIHTRKVPEMASFVLAAAQVALAQLGDSYRLQQGASVAELVPKAATKGAGIERLMASPPFAGRLPVFAGDDLTDEAGFATVGKLGGFGILVGPARASAAHFGLPSVMAFRDWLDQIAAGLCDPAPLPSGEAQ